MHIAGGLYREICEAPHWDGVWGSGLRAAVSISGLGSTVTLHGYNCALSGELTNRLISRGIHFQSHPRARDIAFVYFHPLSNPFIEPPVEKIERESCLVVEAENILRFGFLEGSARVNGDRVVYDPQSPRGPEAFSDNGSAANELALVMNEQEFKAYSRSDELDASARNLMNSGGATVLVVKRGIFGAMVYSGTDAPVQVPIYRSSRVFKIGTGDVFSGVFAHYWSQERRNAVEAADLASRAVAVYCEDPISPLNAACLGRAQSVPGDPAPTIEIYGAANTLGRRYALQEARYCLKKLGVDATIADASLPRGSTRKKSVGFVIADGLSDETLSALNVSLESIVILDEEHRRLSSDIDRRCISDDFTSAIYQICTERP